MVSPTHTFKAGAEFRITPQFSARLRYAYQISPVKSEYRSGHEIPTAGTLTQFTLDRATNYFTVGLGYRFSNVYVDLAYMHRYRRSELFPFSPIPSTGENPFNPDEVEPSLAITPQISTLTDHNNSFVLTMGVKF